MRINNLLKSNLTYSEKDKNARPWINSSYFKQYKDDWSVIGLGG
jgi:hypothetical protein